MRHVFILLLSGISLVSSALQLPTTFQEGMVWETTGVTSYPPFESYEGRYELMAASEFVEEDVMKIMEYYFYDGEEIEEFKCYVKTEEEKVFFKLTEDSQKWALMYDFSLQPGEETIAYFPFSPFDQNPFDVVCLPYQSSDQSKTELTVMEVKTWKWNGSQYSDRGRWYRGIGSEAGPLFNVAFHVKGERLKKVTWKGETLYEASASSAKIADDSSISISDDGVLTVSSDTPTYVYDSAGNVTYVLPPGKDISQRLEKGYHIIVTEAGSRKVLVK